MIVQSWASRPEPWPFLTKRLLRIYPGFVLATLLCVFVVGPLATDPREYFKAFWVTGLVKNLLFLEAPISAPVFKGTFYAVLNGAMWTISYEFICYLIVLLFGVIGAMRYRGAWLLATAGIFSALALGHAGIFISKDPFLRLASFFFSGGCFYLYRDYIKYQPKLAALSLVVMIASMFSHYTVELALGTIGAYLLFYFATFPIQPLQSFNRLPDVSYGTYLYGWPIQKLLLWYFPSTSPWMLFPTSLSVCIVLGWISWQLVEKPMMRFKSVSLKSLHSRRKFEPDSL